MLFNSFTASVFLLALTSSVNAQATGSPQTQSGSVFAPALGNPSPGFNDVQRPSQNAPCGDKPISSNLDTSTPIAVGSDGKFNIQVTSFGAGANNSRSIQAAKVDSKGTGDNFVECQIVKNGDKAPSAAGTEEVTLQLPDNTKCGGGTDGNRCLMSIVTDAGDGNCLVLTTTQSSTATTGGKAQTGGQNGGQTDQKQTNTQNGGQAKTNNPGSDKPKNQKRMSRKSRL